MLSYCIEGDISIQDNDRVPEIKALMGELRLDFDAMPLEELY
jgi:hypothetical protein